MGIGGVGIVTNQKKESSGAPFPAGSADNGLSVDNSTGKIVLGNGILSNDAQLLSDRIIPMDGNTIRFEEVPFSVFVRIGGQDFELQTGTSNVTITEEGFSVIRSAAGQARLNLGDIADIMTISMNGNGELIFNSANTGQVGSIDQAAGNWQIGFNPGGVWNGAKLEVVGSLTSDFFVDPAGGAIGLDDINDKGKLFTDAGGAGSFTLPGAGAGIRGLHFMFAVDTGTGITVIPAGSDTISIGNTTGGAGQTVNSTTIGNFLHLVCLGNRWVAVSAQGTWAFI